MATQTHLDHETRLNQILAAARDLIAGGGVDALTVRGIASKVGVTEAAIYRHVSSKEEVLILLLEDVSASLFSAISDATSEDRGRYDSGAACPRRTTTPMAITATAPTVTPITARLMYNLPVVSPGVVHVHAILVRLRARADEVGDAGSDNT